MSRAPVNRDGFHFAIICALHLEREAVEALMDEIFTIQYRRVRGDSNAYTTGILGGKAVVLAYSEQTGTINAARVASNIGLSFQNIDLALVVGIAGGAPQTQERSQIFLGDVLISTLVIQYDFVRQYDNTSIRKSSAEDTLGRNNTEVQNFRSRLRSGVVRHRLIQRTCDDTTRIMTARNMRVPDSSQDILFPSEYRHKHQDPQRCNICSGCTEWYHEVCLAAAQDLSCRQLGCDMSLGRTRHRASLLTSGNRNLESNFTTGRRPVQADIAMQQMQIHFGYFASGNAVMRSGYVRDKLIAREKVIGFEMEGAGVWDQMPTLIVKGVSDYADSHKNKEWQDFAAVRAAACTKAILKEWELADEPQGSYMPPLSAEMSPAASQHSLWTSHDTMASFNVQPGAGTISTSARASNLWRDLGNGPPWIETTGRTYWELITTDSLRHYERIYEACGKVEGHVSYASLRQQVPADLISDAFFSAIWFRLAKRSRGRDDLPGFPKSFVLAALFMLHIKQFNPDLSPREDDDPRGISRERRQRLKRWTKWVRCSCRVECTVQWNFANDDGLIEGAGEHCLVQAWRQGSRRNVFDSSRRTYQHLKDEWMFA